MQTFLPYRNFEKSAKCLDYKRLGKQRVEAWQILQCLLGEGSLSWKNHPAVKMWKDNTMSLVLYGLAICEEWRNRGYKDTLYDKFMYYHNEFSSCRLLGSPGCGNPPDWLTLKFCKRHRSNLLRKDKRYYSKFKWKVPNNLEYIWPI